MISGDLDNGGRGRINPLACMHCMRRPRSAYIQYWNTMVVSGREAFDRLRCLRGVPDPMME